ncbi:MAG: hypothetical protein Q7K55_09175 [Candidatus Levybacteria bacterium]|nr:hypothetical protein [Candidatus Levybacteria bacterium]
MNLLSFVKKNYGIILILLLSFWAIKPLFASGFFPIHDDTQVARVFEMGKMLGSGVFPVRWVPDLGYGYGYPIFNFYAPLAYYVGGLFMLFGFDALSATKIMMVLGIILAGVFMYLLAREFFGELGGLISGLFYIYAPYHAVDIYVRGDVAEFWAYAFIPLMFVGFYKVFQGLMSEELEVDNSKLKIQNSKLQFKAQKYVLIGTIGYAGVILSHNLTALMVTPFLLIFILILSVISYKAKKIFTIYYLLFTIFLGLAISAFFWVPALLEIKNTNVMSQIGGGADFRNHFVCIGQLWNSQWGFGGSTSDCIDGFSFKIGKLHIATSLAAIVIALVIAQIRKSKKGFIVVLSSLGLIASIFFTLEASRPIWETVPAMDFFQYPWRFLLLASFFSSLLAGSLVVLLNKFKIGPYVTVFILLFFLLFFNIKLFNPQTNTSKTSQDYTGERSLKWVASKISDEFLPPNFQKPESEFEVSKEPLPFKETSIEKISNLVSFIGVLALIIGIIVKYGKNKR